MPDASGAVPTATTPTTGLINTAPGSTTTTPGTSPASGGPGAPVTGYNPATANASTAGTTNYNPNAFSVTPNQTVAGQIQNIIASGSPLMTQAETNAKNMMNQRGLINSSQAITAGDSAVLSAATPIATADANTYNTAATNTTQAQNTAAQTNAAAANTAGLQNAAQQTSTSQFNTGQTNAALSGEAAASNTVAQTAQNIAGQTQVQTLQNQGNLANIMANGTINTQITNLTNANKTLLQTSAGAGQLYTQALTNLSAITQNPNLSEAQKTTALNDGVAQLNDALSALNTIAAATGTGAQSTLTFGSTPNPASIATGSTTVGADGNSYSFNGSGWVDANGNPAGSGVILSNSAVTPPAAT